MFARKKSYEAATVLQTYDFLRVVLLQNNYATTCFQVIQNVICCKQSKMMGLVL